MSQPAGPITAFVSVGSNIEPRLNVPEALRRLRRRVEVTGVSTFYWTAALRPPSGPDWPDGAAADEPPPFLNGVLRLRTDLPARALKFDVLRTVEAELGRRRSDDRYAPRTIDLDLVLFGRAVIDEPGLKVPSSDIARPFVARALLELEPELVLPHTGQPLRSLCGDGPVPSSMRPEPDCTRTLRKAIER